MLSHGDCYRLHASTGSRKRTEKIHDHASVAYTDRGKYHHCQEKGHTNEGV